MFPKHLISLYRGTLWVPWQFCKFHFWVLGENRGNRLGKLARKVNSYKSFNNAALFTYSSPTWTYETEFGSTGNRQHKEKSLPFISRVLGIVSMLERTEPRISQWDECMLSSLGLGGVKGLIMRSELEQFISGSLWNWFLGLFVLRTFQSREVTEIGCYS